MYNGPPTAREPVRKKGHGHGHGHARKGPKIERDEQWGVIIKVNSGISYKEKKRGSIDFSLEKFKTVIRIPLILIEQEQGIFQK